ncbi:GNAT family N-acetyltransferase [Effusibacillus lacus]|nr:GNAT family N-acetyltransferase [Effusibacillus lacus]
MNPILIEAWGRKVDPREIFLEGSKTMVIETEDSRLAGFYNFIEDETVLHLNVIVIDTPYQGTGVAESVMRELEQTARQRSCSEIRLNVQTNNSRAIRFYEKMGFVQVAAPFLNTIPMSKKVMTTAKNCQSGSG